MTRRDLAGLLVVGVLLVAAGASLTVWQSRALTRELGAQLEEARAGLVDLERQLGQLGTCPDLPARPAPRPQVLTPRLSVADAQQRP